MYGPSTSLSISLCKRGFSECLRLSDTTNCATSFAIRFGLPFVASKHISGLPLVQYPKPVKNPKNKNSIFIYYFLFSKKDIILLESLKSDGIKIDKKYDNLYKILDSEMPTDIQVMVNNNESASTILRIIEVIGQDELSTLDEDTLFFIISALNQLNIDSIRNKILLKVLPLKV